MWAENEVSAKLFGSNSTSPSQGQATDDLQGETPWVASACADCPGFLVSGAAGAAGAPA